MDKAKKLNLLKWLVWSLAVGFYCYEFIIRVAPSIMIPELTQAFDLNAAEVGTLAAIYLYVYAPMQIPVGILTDHFGARKLLTFASIVAGLGSLLFGIAPHEWIAGWGRFFMGMGSAFGFVGMVYISSHWFSKEKMAFLIGIGNSLGMFGAFIGQGPLSIFVRSFGWRLASIQIGILGILLGVIIFFIVRNDPPSLAKKEQEKRDNTPSLLHYLKLVTKSKQSWINACASLCFYSITVAFAGLWGIPFLEEAYGVSKSFASFAISMIFVGWMVGGPLIGTYSDRLSKRKPLLLFSLSMSLLFLSVVIYLTSIPPIFLFFLLFFLGFFSSGQLLQYSIAIENNPHEAKGTAIAFTNFLTMLGGAITQPLVGFLLDMNGSLSIMKTPYYSSYDYKIALTVFPILVILSILLNLLVQEKDQKHSSKPDLPI